MDSNATFNETNDNNTGESASSMQNMNNTVDTQLDDSTAADTSLLNTSRASKVGRSQSRQKQNHRYLEGVYDIERIEDERGSGKSKKYKVGTHTKA